RRAGGLGGCSPWGGAPGPPPPPPRGAGTPPRPPGRVPPPPPRPPRGAPPFAPPPPPARPAPGPGAAPRRPPRRGPQRPARPAAHAVVAEVEERDGASALREALGQRREEAPVLEALEAVHQHRDRRLARRALGHEQVEADREAVRAGHAQALLADRRGHHV